MNWGGWIAAAAALAAPASAQQAATTQQLAECRLAYGQTLGAVRGLKIAGRENKGEPGVTDVTVRFDVPGLTALGLPVTKFSLRRFEGEDPFSGKTDQTTEIVSQLSAEYRVARTALLKAFGRTKCDAEGTAITYCQLNLPNDMSAGQRGVTMSVVKADSGAIEAMCIYQRKVDK